MVYEFRNICTFYLVFASFILVLSVFKGILGCAMCIDGFSGSFTGHVVHRPNSVLVLFMLILQCLNDIREVLLVNRHCITMSAILRL